jgi:putative transposon-encoded protein
MEQPIKNPTPVERLLNAENLKNVLKELFYNSEIVSTEVKKGSKSSSNIYVHKKYEGKKATVIIWN